MTYLKTRVFAAATVGFTMFPCVPAGAAGTDQIGQAFFVSKGSVPRLVPDLENTGSRRTEITTLSRNPTRAELKHMARLDKAEALAPCTAMAAGYYCLGLGFRDALPAYPSLLQASKRGTFAPMGDKPFAAWVKERAAMPTESRREAEHLELKEALKGEAKALAVQRTLKRIEVGKAPLSMDVDIGSRATQVPTLGDPDGQYVFIMGGKETKQARDNWCGPATFQSIEWANDGTKQEQSQWANELGTSSAGTGITSMVRLTNQKTTWDNAAGQYITQGIGSWDPDKMWGVHVAHFNDGSPAPIIEHPELLETYFEYLEHNGDGHFQVGRGYQKLADSEVRSVAIFEVWNEGDWWGNGNKTWGPHLIPVAKVLGAAKANSNQNIGL